MGLNIKIFFIIFFYYSDIITVNCTLHQCRFLYVQIFQE